MPSRPSSLPEPTKLITATNGATLRFYRADCLELLPQLAAESIDAIVTSPPYNLGIRYRSYRDRLPRDEYLAWTGDWIQAAKRVLRPDGSLFLNVGAKPTDPWAAIELDEHYLSEAIPRAGEAAAELFASYAL